MAGRPVFSGAVQVTNRLVVLSATEDTEGAAGRAGGSFTSVTLIVMEAVAVPPWPSSTLTITE